MPNSFQLDPMAPEALTLLAQVFWGPDEKLCADLLGPGGRLLGDLAQHLGGDAARAGATIRAHLAGFDDPARLCLDLEPRYVRLFISDRGGSLTHLYHSAHVGEGGLMGPPAREMAARLEAAGLDLGEKSGHPPDHLGVELEYLALMLTEAMVQDQPDLADQARALAGGFISPWVDRLAQRLEQEEDAPFFAPAARITATLLAALSRDPA